MVRVKHRYLLVNILYPEPEQYPRKATLADTIQFHHPSPDDLTPQLLARAIRDQISLLYGDYGAGLTNSGLNGDFTLFEVRTVLRNRLTPLCSQISFSCNIDGYHKMLTRQLSARVGWSNLYDSAPEVLQICASQIMCHAGGESIRHDQEK